MPYLRPDQRAAAMRRTDNSGELNYKITMAVIEYLRINGLNYQSCNDIVGALDNAKDEFKRRVQNPYEDRKIKENGDVYPPEFAG